MSIAQAAPVERRVLLISSYHPDFPTFFKQINGVRDGLAEAGFEQPDLVLDVEFMDTKRFYSEELVTGFYNRLAKKLAKLPPYDLILTADDNASKSAIRQQQALFGDAPIVFFGVNDRTFAIEQDRASKVTGVVEATSMLETAELAASLSPGHPLIVIADATPSGQSDLTTFLAQVEGRLNIQSRVLSLADMTFAEFETALSTFPEKSNMLLLSAYRDSTGASLSFSESLKRIVAVYPGRIFHLWRHGIGKGVLGGVVVSHFEQGKRAAELAATILKGESPAAIRVVRDSPNVPLFDYQMVQRHGIHRSLLPDESLFLNEPPTGIRFTPDELAWLRAHDKIVVGGETDWAPFDFVDETGDYAGMANDYLKIIGEKLGLEVEFVTGPSWDELLTMARQKKIDLLPALYHTKGRAAYLHYTKPYSRVTEFIYGHEEGQRLYSMADLEDKTVAVVKRYKIEQELRTNYPHVKVISAPDIQAALRMIITRDADAFIGDITSTSYNIQRHSLVGIKAMAEATYREQTVHMAVRGDWPVLRDLIQKVFDVMPQSEHAEIKARWITPPLVNQPQLSLTDREKTWLDEHPSITLGFTTEFQPLIIQAKDDVLSGVLVDIYRELEMLTGLEIKIDIDTWPAIIEKTKRGEIDGLLASASTLAHSIGLLYSQALVEGTPTVFAKTGAPFEINSEADLIGKRIAVLKGVYVIERALATYKEKLEVIETDSVQEMMALVLQGKADVAYGLSYHNYHIAKKMLVGIQPVFYSRQYSADGVAAIRADWPQLVSIINKGLREMGEARLHAIAGKWTRSNGAKLSPKSPGVGLTNEEKTWLLNHPVIRLGVDPNFAPFEWIDDESRYSGIAADYLDLISRRLGIHFQVAPGLSWEQALALGRAKELDLHPMTTPTEDRKKSFLFTHTYVRDPYVIISRDDQAPITGEADLADKKVTLVRGYSATELVLKQQPDLIPVYVENELESLLQVAGGEADATVGHLGTLGEKIRLNHLNNLKVAARTDFKTTGMGMAVRDDWPILRDILNKALASITLDEKRAILDKWWVGLHDTDAASFRAQLTAWEREWLETHPVVRVMLDPAWGPVEYRDDEGRYQGISMDYLKHLEELLGIRFEIAEGLLWSEGVVGMREKRIDMAASMARTPERGAFVLFADSHLSMPVNIFARNDVSYIGGLNNLAGKRVVVVKGYAVTEWLSRDYPDIQQVTVSTPIDALKMVSAGKVDAFVGNVVTTSYYLGKLRMNNVRVAGETPYAYNQSMTVRDDWPTLVGILNKALATIEQPERDAIFNRWMSIRYQHETDYTLVSQMLVAVAILLTLFFYWNRRLALEVARRKQAQESVHRRSIELEQANMDLSASREAALNSMQEAEGQRERAEEALQSLAKSQTKLELDEKRLKMLMALSREAPQLDLQTLCEHAVDIAVAISDSEVGYLHIVNEDQETLRLVAWNARALSMCMADHDAHYPISEAGVWADCFRERRTVIHNDYPNLEKKGGVPEGHFPITRHMSTPVVDGDKVHFILGVGQKAQPYNDVDANQIELVAYDVLKLIMRRRAEIDSEIAKDQAEAANRSKSVFLANMSHELRTPLNAILGFSRLLADDPQTSAEQQEKLGIINQSGEHLLGMINNVLELSKIEAGRIELEREIFDLPQMLADIGRMFELRAEKAQLSFMLELDPEMAHYVNSDTSMLRQILINLLDNAFKYTQKGNFSLHARTIPVVDDSAMAMLQLVVEDSGPGIPPEQLEQIFKPFIQASRSPSATNGTGLGLAITKSNVELLGGRITVNSTLGEGSLFRVELPVILADAAETKVMTALKPHIVGLEHDQTEWRLLVVEDNNENRMLLTSLLREIGFDVREAENGEDAISVFEQWQPHFIWMDMRMPVMDGYQATTEIRTLPGGDEVKIVALTSSAFKEQRKRILEAGCDEVVYKPFRTHEIFDTMAVQLGVRYRYKEEAEKQANEPRKVTAESITGLSQEQREKLRNAASVVDDEAFELALMQVQEHDPVLVEGLKALAHEFRYDLILELLE
ncbi:MAG: ABC transporter substrate binding protein [Candidatus Thiodiazotropha endolucinida]